MNVDMGIHKWDFCCSVVSKRAKSVQIQIGNDFEENSFNTAILSKVRLAVQSFFSLLFTVTSTNEYYSYPPRKNGLKLFVK